MTLTPSWLPPGPDCAPIQGKVVQKLDVPYIHQVKDVEGADGNWACGPTSVVMVLAYYGKIEPWSDYLEDMAALTPTVQALGGEANDAHMVLDPSKTPSRTATARKDSAKTATPASSLAADYAPYITNAYTYNGHTYNSLGAGPRGTRLAGLYGTICPAGLADWGMIMRVFEWNGLTSRHIGTGWDSIVASLKKGHPVLISNALTPEGHVLVAIGYTNNGQLVVNDPYGNRFADGYGGNNGDNVIYRLDCMRIKAAVEVIGTYPPPVRPTRTPRPVAAVAQSQPPAAAQVSAGAQPDENTSREAGAVSGPGRVSHDNGREVAWPGEETQASTALGVGSIKDRPDTKTSPSGGGQTSPGSSGRAPRRSADTGWVLWTLRLMGATVVAVGVYALNKRRLVFARMRASSDAVSEPEAPGDR